MKKKANLERSGGVVGSLSWSEMLSEVSSQTRRELKEQVLSDIETFDSKTDQPTAQGMKVANMLRGKDFRFVGFIDGVGYIKMDGGRDDLKAKFLHPHAMIALLYFHRPTATLIIAAPGLDFSETGAWRGIKG